MTEPETATDFDLDLDRQEREAADRLYRRRAAARSERLLPPYGRRVPDQIEARRRIAEDLLEVLVAHQKLWAIGVPVEFRPVVELVEAWWVALIAHNLLTTVMDPQSGRSEAMLAQNFAVRFRQVGRQRVVAWIEWAASQVSDYTLPPLLSDPAFWRR